MKNLMIMISLIMGLTLQSYAQKSFEKREKVKNQEIHLDFQFADDIKIHSWNKDEVYVKVSVNINDNKHNDHFYFESETKDDQVSITSKIKDLDKIRVKKMYKGHESWTVDMDIVFEVYLPKSSELVLETISGSIFCNDYAQIKKIKTISGDIDVSLDKTLAADISMKTISGEVYSNLDLEYGKAKEGMHTIVGSNIDARLNQGGKNISLETISGNIYLRKE